MGSFDLQSYYLAQLAANVIIVVIFAGAGYVVASWLRRR